MKLWCYSKPKTMTGHFTDDVAICEAKTLDEAISKFSTMYDKKIVEGNVKEVIFNNYGIFVATDY